MNRSRSRSRPSFRKPCSWSRRRFHRRSGEQKSVFMITQQVQHHPSQNSLLSFDRSGDHILPIISDRPGVDQHDRTWLAGLEDSITYDFFQAPLGPCCSPIAPVCSNPFSCVGPVPYPGPSRLWCSLIVQEPFAQHHLSHTHHHLSRTHRYARINFVDQAGTHPIIMLVDLNRYPSMYDPWSQFHNRRNVGSSNLVCDATTNVCVPTSSLPCCRVSGHL